MNRYLQPVIDFLKKIFGVTKSKTSGAYRGAFGFAQHLLRKDPRSKPEKIWCFYAEPYRRGFAVTGLTFSGVLALIAIAFLIVGLITLGMYLVAIILYIVAGIALIALGLSGLKGFEGGWAGIITTIITVAIAAYLWEPIFGFIDGFWVFTTQFSQNLNYITYVTSFLGSYWHLILAIIITPATIVLTIAVLTILTVYLLRGFEQLVTWSYGIRHRCPECSQKTEPAVYLCSVCKAEHPYHLIPSKYGIFSHECVNGHKMPTMLVLGRNRDVPHHCPNDQCKADLSSGAVGTDKHIAFVGGRTSGKTCLLVQVTRHLLAKGAEIPEIGQRQEFGSLNDLIEKGQVPGATSPKHVYRAFQMTLKKGAFPYHFYFYDLAGEKFEHAQDAAAHRFFTTLDSIAFVFDPFSVPEFKQKHQPPTGVAVASQDPLELIRNLSQVLERYNDKSKVRKISLNVLLVKSDTGYLNGMVTGLMEQSKMNEFVKQFMREELGQAAFIHHVEQHFDKINYFPVSALGRAPSPTDTSPFMAQNLKEAFDRIWKDIKVKVN
ncbi:MAG: hypothetical protein IPN76_21975 [Saprospiraceae bacterium]|nr:hypothetical protein [Saprospiraceae bacterium]